MRKVCARQHAAPQWFLNDVMWRGLGGRRRAAAGLPKILSAIIHNEVQTGDQLWQQPWWNDISSVRLTFLEVVDGEDVSFACFCLLFHVCGADVECCVWGAAPFCGDGVKLDVILSLFSLQASQQTVYPSQKKNFTELFHCTTVFIFTAGLCLQQGVNFGSLLRGTWGLQPKMMRVFWEQVMPNRITALLCRGITSEHFLTYVLVLGQKFPWTHPTAAI